MSEKFRLKNILDALGRLTEKGLPPGATLEEIVRLLFAEAKRERNIVNGKKWRDEYRSGTD
jgi:hypothetical protein